MQIRMKKLVAAFCLFLLLSSCTAPPLVQDSSKFCSVTQPVWAKPPDDAAVLDPPDYGYYFINEDRSIWASAGWADQEAYTSYAGNDGVKVGWFRPAGAELVITGERMDAEAPPLESRVPCCYPTRFQATGLYFPTEGCWEVNAQAADKEITFVVRIKPANNLTGNHSTSGGVSQ